LSRPSVLASTAATLATRQNRCHAANAAAIRIRCPETAITEHACSASCDVKILILLNPDQAARAAASSDCARQTESGSASVNARRTAREAALRWLVRATCPAMSAALAQSFVDNPSTHVSVSDLHLASLQIWSHTKKTSKTHNSLKPPETRRYALSRFLERSSRSASAPVLHRLSTQLLDHVPKTTTKRIWLWLVVRTGSIRRARCAHRHAPSHEERTCAKVSRPWQAWRRRTAASLLACNDRKSSDTRCIKLSKV